MPPPNASHSGPFRIGGDRQIHRLGFGAMRITGSGVWGEPSDRPEALETLRALRGMGVNFIDTADCYGPRASERLIREALYPYDGLFIATKGGLVRPGPDQWVQKGDPKHLIETAHESRDILGVEQIDLWYLHRIDAKVPRDEQFGAVRELIDTGVIRYAGLSEVSVDDIAAAGKQFQVAAVQNRYNLADREHEDVLDYCEAHSIGFVPWFPLGAGTLATLDGLLARIAHNHGATPSQIALAWLLSRSPVMLPIRCASKRAHLEENVAAAAIKLADAEFGALSAAIVKTD